MRMASSIITTSTENMLKHQQDFCLRIVRYIGAREFGAVKLPHSRSYCGFFTACEVKSLVHHPNASRGKVAASPRF
jgi:hypothetical protein